MYGLYSLSKIFYIYIEQLNKKVHERMSDMKKISTLFGVENRIVYGRTASGRSVF